MSNLLSALYYQEKKSRLLRGELLLAVFMPIFILVNSYLKTNITNAYIYKVVGQLFGHSPIICLFVVLNAAHVWGQDSESGVLRNKIICGHRRRDIYLSYFITVALSGMLATGCWLAIYLPFGLLLFGMPALSPMELVGYVMADFLLAVAMASVSCFLASFNRKESYCLIAGIGLFCGMMIVGLTLNKRFSMEEIVGYSMQGANQAWFPGRNGLYVGGIARILLEVLICILPGAQAIMLEEQLVEHLWMGPLVSLLVCLLVNRYGIIKFEMKDIT